MSALVFPRVPLAGSAWVLYRQINTWAQPDEVQTPAVTVLVTRAEVLEDDPLLGRVWVNMDGRTVEREMWIIPNIGVDGG